jgi:hypothetical protein
VEDIDVVCLVPKSSSSVQEDIKEILGFVAEDFTTCGKGIQVMDGYRKGTFTQRVVLGLVTGDLQGVPDILGTKHPTADSVRLPSLSLK